MKKRKIKMVIGFSIKYTPRGPAHMKNSKHPPIPIIVTNPFAMVLVKVTEKETKEITISNRVEIALVKIFNALPAVFLIIFMDN